MEEKMKKPKIVFSFIVLLLLISANTYPAMIANYSCIYFLPDQCVTGEKANPAPTIGFLVVEGAGYFLDSHADMLLFLNRIEMAELTGIDYTGLQVLLANAIEKMEKANAAYFQLKKLAAETPYNPPVIDKLETFDYQSFQKKRGLNEVIFRGVSELLARGDVRGVYKRLHKETAGLLKYLYRIKSSIDSGIFPEISVLWRANEKYAETLLFGQICAEIFYTCK
jgi:hypothetical protein